MRRAAPLALAVALLAGCGGGGGKNVVAHVGDEGMRRVGFAGSYAAGVAYPRMPSTSNE